MSNILSVIKQHLPTLIVVLIALYIFHTWMKPECNCNKEIQETLETDMPSTEQSAGSAMAK